MGNSSQGQCGVRRFLGNCGGVACWEAAAELLQPEVGVWEWRHQEIGIHVEKGQAQKWEVLG